MHVDSFIVLALVSVVGIIAVIAYVARKMNPPRRELLKHAEFVRKLRTLKPKKLTVVRTQRANRAKGLPGRHELHFTAGKIQYYTEADQITVKGRNPTPKERLQAMFTRLITVSCSHEGDQAMTVENPVRFFGN